jgi:hypothetical protein
MNRKDTDVFSQSMEPCDDDYDDDCLVELPDVRQNDTYSCGAAVAMSVGKYFGVGPDTLKEWKDLLGTTRAKSTTPEAICKVLTDLGCQVVCKQDMTEDDLCYYHKLGIPVICPIQEWGDPRVKAADTYGHWVAVIGVGFGYVFVQDPSIDNVMDGEGGDYAEGRMMIKCEHWDDVWHDEGVGDEPYDHYGIAVTGPCEDE